MGQALNSRHLSAAHAQDGHTCTLAKCAPPPHTHTVRHSKHAHAKPCISKAQRGHGPKQSARRTHPQTRARGRGTGCAAALAGAERLTASLHTNTHMRTQRNIRIHKAARHGPQQATHSLYSARYSRTGSSARLMAAASSPRPRCTHSSSGCTVMRCGTMAQNSSVMMDGSSTGMPDTCGQQ